MTIYLDKFLMSLIILYSPIVIVGTLLILVSIGFKIKRLIKQKETNNE
jgi:hypothetical protein